MRLVTSNQQLVTSEFGASLFPISYFLLTANGVNS